MDVVSMFKSKDALVPCRNLSLRNRFSLTATEKAAAFPFWAGFMPNSPMPMLDACDWPLLTTVSTIRGGCTVSSSLFCLLLSVTGSDPRCRLSNLIILTVLGGFVMTVGVVRKLSTDRKIGARKPASHSKNRIRSEKAAGASRPLIQIIKYSLQYTYGECAYTPMPNWNQRRL